MPKILPPRPDRAGFGSPDPAVVDTIHTHLAQLAGAAGAPWVPVLLHGSGLLAVEAAFTSLIPLNGELLVVVTGPDGAELAEVARRLEIPVTRLRSTDPARLATALRDNASVTHVAVVDAESDDGTLLDVEALARVVRQLGRRLLLDARLSLGFVPLPSDPNAPLEAVLGVAHRGLGGPEGVAIVLIREAGLVEAAGTARSRALDLHRLWRAWEDDGVLAGALPPPRLQELADALVGLAAEGVDVRGARCAAYRRALATALEVPAPSFGSPERLLVPDRRFAHPLARNGDAGSMIDVLGAQALGGAARAAAALTAAEEPAAPPPGGPSSAGPAPGA